MESQAGALDTGKKNKTARASIPLLFWLWRADARAFLRIIWLSFIFIAYTFLNKYL